MPLSIESNTKLSDGHTIPMLGLGVYLIENGKSVEEVIAENDPNADKALFGRAYNALGACYLKSGKPKDAAAAALDRIGDADLLAQLTKKAPSKTLRNRAKKRLAEVAPPTDDAPVQAAADDSAARNEQTRLVEALESRVRRGDFGDADSNALDGGRCDRACPGPAAGEGSPPCPWDGTASSRSPGRSCRCWWGPAGP